MPILTSSAVKKFISTKNSGNAITNKVAQLCTLTLDDDPCVICGGEAVYTKDKLVGRVRSEGFGYTVRKNIAIRSNWQIKGLRSK